MLNSKAIKRSLAKYIEHKDPDVRARLAMFGPLILKAAEIADGLQQVTPELPPELIEKVRLSQGNLLEAVPAVIDRDAFIDALQAMGDVYLATDGFDEEARKACADINWRNFASESMLALAGSDPMTYLATCEELAGDMPFFDVYVLPTIIYTLRAFLDSYGTYASSLINATNGKDDTTHHNRPVHCPVCGSEAAIASVTETTNHGNVKNLWCTCCGSRWLFERIRCMYCGDQIVSDLSYVHDEGDDKHRLHICKSCGDAGPTVFAGEELNFNPDVEQLVMTGLELQYYQSLADKAN